MFNLAVSLGDLTGILTHLSALEGSGESLPGDDAEREIKERLAGGRGLNKLLTFYLLKGDFRRLLKLSVNARASKRSHRFDQFAAVLMGLKMMTTLISKDIEEITGVHVRAKTGLGASVALDRVLLFPAAADILAGFTLEPSTEVLRNRS